MALNDYLVEEIRLDHADGHLSRREALRLLGLMGMGLAAAGTWLDAAPAAAVTKRTAAPTTRPAAPATAITFPGPAGTLRGRFAAATRPKGAVLVIHENRGLTPHFQAFPNRLARDGYTALAIDLASRAGGTDKVADQMPAPLSGADPDDLVADMKAGLTELARRSPGSKLGVMGFCFGGAMVWNLLAAGDERIAAAAPFYGVGPSPADFTGSPGAAVLAVYAELDARVNATRDAMAAALKAGGLTHRVLTAPGADHAFFNDTGPRYNAVQAAAVYKTLLAWFAVHLKR